MPRWNPLPGRLSEHLSHMVPLRVAGWYLLFGLLWIWLTDLLIPLFDIREEPAYFFAGLKGTIFVLVSAALIFWLLRRHLPLFTQKTSVLQAITEGTQDAIFVKDVQGRYVLLNQTSLGLLGKTAEQCLGRTDADLFGQENATRFRSQDERVMQQTNIEVEERRLLIRGVERTYLVSKFPYRDDRGKVIGIIGISRDITARKQAEDALRASEERYRNLVELAPDGIALFVDGRVAYINTAGAKLLQGTPNDFMGELLNEYIHPDDLAESMRRQQAVLMEQQAQPQHDIRMRALDGHYVLLGVCAGPCLIDGKPAIQVVARDMTERHRAQLALQESEERYRTLIEANLDAIFINRGDVIAYANPAFLRLVGASTLDQVIGKTPYDFVHPNDHEAIRERIYQVTTNHQIATLMHQHYVRLDGTVVDVEVMGVPVVDQGVVSIEVIVRDITERLRFERILQNSNSFRESIIRTAGEGIAVCEAIAEFPFIRFSVWNDRMIELTGYTLDEINRLGWYQTVYPDENVRQQCIERMQRMRNGDDLRGEVWTITHRDGTPRNTAISTSLIDTENGPAVVAVMQDMTARYQVEQALRNSEERNRRLMAMLPNPVFIFVDGIITYANASFVSLMGAQSEAELIGLSALAIAHPSAHDAICARWEQMRRTGQAAPSMESRIVRLDGRTVPVFSVANPIAVGDSLAVLIALFDLSEREQSAELLRSIMQSVNDALITIDEYGIIQSVNPATSHLFGYAERELLGQNISLLMPSDLREQHDSFISNYIRTRQARVLGRTVELEGQRRSGKTFPMELTVTEFTFNDRPRFTGVVRDITERRRLEAQILQAQKMQAIGRLAGGIAHDFNNMLMLINGHSDLLLQILPSEDPQRPHLSAIHEAGQRAARLTNQLLTFSRKAPIEPKQIDLNQLIDETGSLLRPLLGSGIDLQFELDPRTVIVHMDRGHIEQVLMNLVLNARDAMPNGGAIHVHTQLHQFLPVDLQQLANLRSGTYAQLTIRDTGEGMSDDVRANIFEPFFTTKDVGKGTGLGLAVVDGIVAQAGGAIRVASTLGVGTTFTIWLPAVEIAYEI